MNKEKKIGKSKPLKAGQAPKPMAILLVEKLGNNSRLICVSNKTAEKLLLCPEQYEKYEV